MQACCAAHRFLLSCQTACRPSRHDCTSIRVGGLFSLYSCILTTRRAHRAALSTPRSWPTSCRRRPSSTPASSPSSSSSAPSRSSSTPCVTSSTPPVRARAGGQGARVSLLFCGKTVVACTRNGKLAPHVRQLCGVLAAQHALTTTSSAIQRSSFGRTQADQALGQAYLSMQCEDCQPWRTPHASMGAAGCCPPLGPSGPALLASPERLTPRRAAQSSARSCSRPRALASRAPSPSYATGATASST
jgi:hypothetical protein